MNPPSILQTEKRRYIQVLPNTKFPRLPSPLILKFKIRFRARSLSNSNMESFCSRTKRCFQSTAKLGATASWSTGEGHRKGLDFHPHCTLLRVLSIPSVAEATARPPACPPHTATDSPSQDHEETCAQASGNCVPEEGGGRGGELCKSLSLNFRLYVTVKSWGILKYGRQTQDTGAMVPGLQSRFPQSHNRVALSLFRLGIPTYNMT